MFLFVSHTDFKQTGTKLAGIKQAGLFAALLMLSLTASATLDDGIEEHVQSAHESGMQQQTVQSQQGQMPDNRAQDSSSTHWPQSHQIDKSQTNNKIIPPPPPGPYRSTALSDYSVSVPSFDYGAGKYQQYNPASVPMGTFSPDVPWPKNLRPSQYPGPYSGQYNNGSDHWLPENNNYRHYNFGNRYDPRMNAPYMNGAGMNGSRWMPSMGVAPQWPYDERLNYAPNYGSNYAPRYGRPVINNNGVKATNPPYPQSSKPGYPDQNW
jgi:hypothetical protein